jgi:hypothetical protein
MWMPLKKNESPLPFIRRLHSKKGQAPKPKPFIQRHSHLISFFGALIVFVTFIVKEGLADRWKEDASAIDAAESVYSIRDDTYNILLALDAIYANEAAIDLSPKTVRQTLERVERTIALADSQTDTMRTLLDRFSHSSSSDLEILNWHTVLNDINDSIAILRKFATAAGEMRARDGPVHLPGTPPSNKWLDQEEAREMEELHNILERTNSLFPKIEALHSKILVEAETARQKAEHRGKRAWWIAAALYTLGWTLAVVGRLYGLSTASD